MELKTVIKFSNPEDNHGRAKPIPYKAEIFCSTTNNLNLLALQTTITKSQAIEDPKAPEKEIMNTNGTWESIAKWGKNGGLDRNQQTADTISFMGYHQAEQANK
jgi:hypothetical protein